MTKGKMIKKIFAVVGIVLGAVLAFAGAIIGVMFAMGKFKEPVNYPEALIFEQPVVMVDQNNPVFETTGGKKIYSFTLTGKTSDEYGVTQKSCYLSFSKGKDIITLCNSRGEPLKPSQTNGNQYLINCNEPVYYFINTFTTTADGECSKVGKVVLTARDERGAVWGSNELTINVDSEINEVYVYAPEGENGVLSNLPLHIVGEAATQNIELSIGGKIYIDSYDVKPSNALKPFVDVDAKEIELYYVGQEKHYLVNAETLANDNELKNALKDASGNSIIQYDQDLGYYITAMAPGRYQFKIAYFKTYNEKEAFDSDVVNAELEGYYRVQEMEHTILTVNVENTVVSNLFINGSVNLNLFLDNNYLTLGNEKVINGANNSLLGLNFSPANQQTSLRYNEALFVKNNNLNLNNIISLKASDNSLVSVVNADVTKDGEQYKVEFTDTKNQFRSFVLGTTSNILQKTLNYGYYETIGENLVYHNRIIVTSITESASSYTTSGMLVIDGVDGELKLKLLPAGTYLDFLVEGDVGYSTWQECEVETYNKSELTGKQATWKILAKEEATDVVLGALVVNNDGTYCFRNVKAAINAQPLSASNIDFKNGRTHNLTISYDNSNNVDLTAVGASLSSRQIFEIPNNVSYQNAVLLTKQLGKEDPSDAYSVAVIPEISYDYNNETYVLVGYWDDNNNFVNRVRVNKNAKQESTNVYVAQIKTGYGITAEEYITNNKALDIAVFFNQTNATITINVSYDISAIMDGDHFDYDLIDVSYQGHQYEPNDEKIGFVTGEEGKITIKMKEFKDGQDVALNPQPDLANILTNLREMLGDEFKNLFTMTPKNIEIDSTNANGNGFDINIIVGSTLAGNALVKPVFNYNGETIKLLPIEILSKTPTAINFEYKVKGGDTLSYQLPSNNTGSLPQLDVVIGYSGSNYTYSWKYGNDDFENILSFENFKLFPTYSEGTVVLSSDDVEVLAIEGENIVVKGVGTCVLKAQAGDAFGFIKVVVTAEENFVFKIDKTENETSDDFYSFDSGIYGYDADLTDSTNTIQKLDDKVDIILIENGEYKYNPTTKTLYYIDEFNKEISLLTLNYENNAWKFTRTNDLFSALTIKAQLKTITHGVVEVNIHFNPSLAVNKIWKNSIVYKGTPVKLYEVVEKHTDTTNAMFKVVNASQTANPVQVVDSNGNLVVSVSQFDACGEKTIIFKTTAGVELSRATITIVPNVIINITNTSFVAGQEGQTMFDAYSYKTDVTFGDEIGEYPSINSQNFASYTTGMVSGCETSSEYIVSLNGGVSIPASVITDISITKEEEITISFEGDEIPASNILKNKAAVTSNVIEISVRSAYTLKDIAKSVEAVEDNLTEKLALVLNEIDEFEIVAVEVSGLTVENNKITTLISKPTECEFTITLEIGGDEFTLVVNIEVNPYVPLKIEEFEVNGEETLKQHEFIYSETAYKNLIERVFNVDQNISSIKATGIIVDNGNITQNINPYFEEFGFGGTETPVTTARLDGDDAEIIVVFDITYNTGETYTYRHPLIIKNRDQYVPVLYPYEDIKLAGSNAINLVEVDFVKQAAGTLSSNTFATIDVGESYEPVLVGQTIDLAEIINAKARVNIKDMVADADEVIAEIDIYAATSTMSDYIYDDKQITIRGTQIEFGTDTSYGPYSMGYIKFKFTTTHGNIGFYNVRVYNKLDGTGVEATSNQNIQYSLSNNNSFEITKSGQDYYIFGDKKLEVEENFKMSSFDSSKVSMYLLNVTSPAGVTQNNGIKVGGADFLNTEFFKKLSSNTKINAQIQNYATIKVAMVYRNGSIEYCFGTLTIFVKPATYETENAEFAEEHEEIELNDKVSGYKSGVYTANLPYSTSTLLAPFNGVTGASFVGTEPTGIEIDSANGYKLNLTSYVEEELTFIVQYSINGLLINVEYVYEGFDFRPTTQQVTVGEFVEGAFDNVLPLDSILEGYSKAINITINGTTWENVAKGADSDIPYSTTKTIESGESGVITFVNQTSKNRPITFPQFSVGYTVEISITFVGYKENLTKLVSVYVLPGIYVENITNNTPIVSTLTGNYSGDNALDGSEITFTQGKNVYFVGESFKVYMADDGKLNISYTTENGVNYVNGTSFTIDGNGDSISFPHMARADKVVDLAVTFTYNGQTTSQYQYNGVTINNGTTLKVELAKTYSGLQLNYLKDGAQDENVVKGDWGNVDNLLFNDNDTQRISLINAANSGIVSDGSVDFFAMGFNVDGNPNKISYQAGEDMILIDGDLSFAEVVSNDEKRLKIVNNAGVEVDYVFYLMKSSLTQKDGIVFDEQVNTRNNNASFVLGSNDGSLARVELGTLTDGKNIDVYSIACDGVLVDGESVSGIYNELLKDDGNSEDYVFTYSITTDYGTLVLTLGDTKNLFVEFAKVKSNVFEKISFVIDLVGDTDYIFDGFEIVLYNYVTPDIENLSATVLATNSFNVKDNIQFTKPDGTEIENADLKYELVQAKQANGDDIVINNNVLFTYNDSTGLVITKNVPENTRVKLTYRVLDGDIYIRTIDFNLTIENNILYVVNGKALDTLRGETEFITDYNLYEAAVLSVDDDGLSVFDDFALTQSLVYNKTTNNNVLSFRLFEKSQGISNFGTLSGMALTNVAIALKDDTYADKVEIRNRTDLVFLEDFTTPTNLPLVLTITHTITGNDSYVVNWKINVKGLLKVDYIAGASYNDVLAEQSSGSTVLLTLPAYDSNEPTNNIVISQNIKSGQPNVVIDPTVEYVITEAETITDVKELFAGEATIATADIVQNGLRIETSLPIVRQGATFVVSYRIKISYMGLPTASDIDWPFYYVSYKVRNNNSFAVNEQSVNVDNSDYIADTDNNNIKTDLKLFAYTETYTRVSGEGAGLVITPLKSDGTYIMQLSHDDVNYTMVSGSLLTTSKWIDGTATSDAKGKALELRKTNEVNMYEFEVGEYTVSSDTYSYSFTGNKIKVRRAAESKEGMIINSVNYTNIEQFIETINETDAIKFANLSADKGYAGTGSEKTYTLQYNNSEHYFYINLAEGLDTGEKLFNNSLTTDLQLCSTTVIYEIKNFELKTANMIEAKDYKYLSTIFKESQYGTANKAYVGEKYPLIGVFNDSSISSGKINETTGAITLDDTLRGYVYNWISINNPSITINKDYVVGLTLVKGFTPFGNNDTMSGTYKLYQITYTIDGGSSLYNITTQLYALGSSTGDITLVDYATNSLYNDRFYVEYDAASTSQSLGFNPITKYSMVDGKWSFEGFGDDNSHSNEDIITNAGDSSSWVEEVESVVGGYTFKYQIEWQKPTTT